MVDVLATRSPADSSSTVGPIARFLDRVSPDVICLNEVQIQGFEEMTQQLERYSIQNLLFVHVDTAARYRFCGKTFPLFPPGSGMAPTTAYLSHCSPLPSSRAHWVAWHLSRSRG